VRRPATKAQQELAGRPADNAARLRHHLAVMMP